MGNFSEGFPPYLVLLYDYPSQRKNIPVETQLQTKTLIEQLAEAAPTLLKSAVKTVVQSSHWLQRVCNSVNFERNTLSPLQNRLILWILGFNRIKQFSLFRQTWETQHQPPIARTTATVPISFYGGSTLSVSVVIVTEELARFSLCCMFWFDQQVSISISLFWLNSLATFGTN